MSSDRGRGRPLARGRGGAGVGRGGTRRQFDVNSRYYEQRSTADSDNWRRRDPDPDNHQPDQMAEPQSFIPEQPPSYPPFPSKTLSPTQIGNYATLEIISEKNDLKYISPGEYSQLVTITTIDNLQLFIPFLKFILYGSYITNK